MSTSGFMGCVRIERLKIGVGKHQGQEVRKGSAEMSGHVWECKDINFGVDDFLVNQENAPETSLTVNIEFDPEPYFHIPKELMGLSGRVFLFELTPPIPHVDTIDNP